ncbi:MAG TPA: CCA tRNA nucleotidyltransferase [Lachnospiraceae bacterium]|nr:CCA tRNA nucleotidyltransferase [Lachnospiraceae bacterium]
MRLKIPAGAGLIIQKLKEHGFEAYVVGGCVRDGILGREPDDWDITTSASPCEVKQIFNRTVDTGLQHGTVTVLIGSRGFEVTTYRIDGEYEDGRHPKEVVFTRSLREDLRRRDFTINAMAYNDEGGLVDLFGGMGDLQRHIVRCVGDPAERFGEDALRIMRAVRFAAQLDFTIDGSTREALTRLAPTLKRISAERVQAELVKLLISGHPEYIGIAWETGITGAVLPEFDAAAGVYQHTPHHMDTVGVHTLKALCAVRADKVLRLAMLLHDLGKAETKKTGDDGIDHFPGHGEESASLAGEILRRLKFDNDTVTKVVNLVRWHDIRYEAESAAVRRMLSVTGREMFPLYMEVQRADVLAQSEYKREEKLEKLADIQRLYEETLAAGYCTSLRELAVTGRDLTARGVPAGPGLGAMLKDCLALVLEEPEKNTKEALLGYLGL